MNWELQGTTLTGSDEESYEIFPRELWYVVPARASYVVEEGKVRPLEFAFVLHNASLAEGLLVSPSAFTGGPRFRPRKGGSGGDAEELLEQVRKEKFPEKPSRFNSYFLNPTRELAELRAQDFLRGNKILVRCFLVLNGAKVHFGDIDVYERLEGRPDDLRLAEKYWSNFAPTNDAEFLRLEVVAESALYFPDWRTFPRIPLEDLVEWQKHNISSK